VIGPVVVLSRRPGRVGAGAGSVCRAPGRGRARSSRAGAVRPGAAAAPGPLPAAAAELRRAGRARDAGPGSAAPAGPGRSGARHRSARWVSHRDPHPGAMAGAWRRLPCGHAPTAGPASAGPARPAIPPPWPGHRPLAEAMAATRPWPASRCSPWPSSPASWPPLPVSHRGAAWH